MTRLTLVTGARAGAREAAIAADLVAGDSCAILLEGLPDGTTALSDAFLASVSPRPTVERIAPGCMCCTGNLVLRVTLNRILRRRPARLYIGIATATHLEQLRLWLSQAPYDLLLAPGPDLHAGVPDGPHQDP